MSISVAERQAPRQQVIGAQLLAEPARAIDSLLFVSAWGTLGDISPLISVALEMRRRGHAIQVAGVGDFSFVAARHGLHLESEWTDLEVFEGDEQTMAGLMNSETGQRWLRREWVPMAEQARTARLFRERAVTCHDTLERLCSDHRVSAVICDISSFHIVSQICKKLGAVHIVSTPMPYQPSRTFNLSSRPALSGRSQITNQLYWWWRRARKPRSFRHYFDNQVFHLLSASPTLFPRPSDWPSNQQVTGYCSLSRDQEVETWQPPGSLLDFLSQGEPPIYVGFGSYPFFTGPRGADMLRMIQQTTRAAGYRAVICTGFSELDPALETPADMYRLDYAPHEWLLPRCQAAIHHGGGGTTYACLAAGIPMIAYPYQTDQFLWTRRIGQLGIGPGYRHTINQMSATNLADKLRSLARPEPRATAARLGAQVRRERNGAAVQADAIESILAHSRAGHAPADWLPPWS